MSSWKKAAKANQKTHRERHQPESRQHLGLLEKKKDYKKRAEDYQQKGKTLKLLRKRTLDKNPDEFYFHMIKSKIKDGVHHEFKEEIEDSNEQIKLMKSQDLKYINMKRTIESRKIKRMLSELHMSDVADSTPNTHTFFVDEGEEKDFDVAKRLDTHPALLKRKSNRLKIADLAKLSIPADDTNIEESKKKKQQVYKEMVKRIQREKELSTVQRKIEMKQYVNAVTAIKPKLIKRATTDTSPIYYFLYNRKK